MASTSAAPKNDDLELSAKDRLDIYRTMLTSRWLDDAEIALKRQNKIYFQISGAGHEATQVAAARVLKSGYDWFYTYYRDRALCLGLGVSPHEMLLQAVGAVDDPASGGRQMPSHWGHVDYNLVSSSSPTGTQFLNAVGCAEAGRMWGQFKNAAHQHRPRFEKDEVVYVSSGDGTTSEGEFYEALSSACNLKLPVMFHIQDNGYAISVPVEVNTPGGSISKVVAGFPDLEIIEFDGCDPEESIRAWERGAAYARSGQGPVLMHAQVVRPYSHSMSDDERMYRSAEELKVDAERDPLRRYRQKLVELADIGQHKIEALENALKDEIENAKDKALAAEMPKGESALDFVFSPDVDPTSAKFDTQAQPEGSEQTMVDLINRCLHDEMERDERIVLFGEDVADATHADLLSDVKGKGGVFKATQNLQRKFGSDRVFNSPLAEANIVGRAVGMASRGIKPVVEIQFFDYIWPAMMQIRSELALTRWRSNNTWSCPAVIRTTYGGYLKGGSVYHSQTGESIFCHIPGLRVVLPSNAQDAHGLLRTAIRCEDPVLFLEHKHLYRQTYNRAPYPGPDYMIPFGKLNVVKEGADLSLITYGALVKRSLDAAAQAAKRGINVEVLDLRTLSPYDWEGIQKSVKKTNKALVVYEDSYSWGSGSEIAARISDELFEHLDGPVRRVASTDTFVGYHPNLEDFILPQTEDVLAAIESLVAY